MKELKSEVFDIEELELFDVSGYRKDREDRRDRQEQRERDSGNDSDKEKPSAWERVKDFAKDVVEIVSSQNTNYDISKDSSRWDSYILSHDRGRD